MQRKRPLGRDSSVEGRLWAGLRAVEGHRFRRKSPFRTFILDFVAHDTGLVILLEDGEPGRRSGHIVRDRLLSEAGYVILRLRKAEIARDLSGALQRIRAVLEDISAPDSV